MQDVKKKKEKRITPAGAAAVVVITAVLISALAFFIFSPRQAGEESEKSLDTSRFAEESSEAPDKISGTEKNIYDDIAVGDYIRLGTYGGEKLQWTVLEKDSGRVTLITTDCIECRAYNDTRTDISWEESTLYAWLNGEFAGSAFSEEDKKLIVVSESGESVTLLDEAGAKKYFEYDAWRSAGATAHAAEAGARVQEGKCWYWLSDTGSRTSFAKYIGFDGRICDGFAVDTGNVGVRPVITVQLGE